MSIKYKGFTIEKAKGKTFGKPTFEKFGKKIAIQDYIEAGREDTEIYPTLEKYGCLTRMERTPSQIYGDFTEYNDLRGNLEKAKKIKDMWNQLDTTIKNEFNNDMNEFIDRGMEWAKNKIEEETKKVETKPVETQPVETQPKTTQGAE